MPRKVITSLEDRLWPYVDRSGNGCWEWQCAKAGAGYGVFVLGKTRHYTHRAAWELTNGPIPDGMFICHHCDNPPCCRPDHLFLGTHADNMRDRVAKGRSGKGSQHSQARFTEDDIRYIRSAYPSVTQAVLAERFNVAPSTISMIVNRVNWPHVE